MQYATLTVQPSTPLTVLLHIHHCCLLVQDCGPLLTSGFVSATHSWEPDAASGYLYNAVHRHYYEPKTGMYYGGEPPAWTVKPAIPAEALCSNDGDRGQGESHLPCGHDTSLMLLLILSSPHMHEQDVWTSAAVVPSK